jgi:TonB family protein
MKRNLILLGALLVLSTAAQIFAQNQTQSPKPSTPTAGETERPKTEIDRLLEEAKARGEIVLNPCLQNCDDKEAVQGVENGRALEMPKPEFPDIARMAHASGTVQVRIIIDVDGTVIAAAAISGHPLLQAASVDAARRTRFSVTKFNGESVKATGVLTYNFVSQ